MPSRVVAQHDNKARSGVLTRMLKRRRIDVILSTI